MILMGQVINLDLIQEIMQNDGSTYLDISNMTMNGRAELAAIRGYIKEVRIIQLNIPHSTALATYEQYVNENFTIPPEKFTKWIPWLPNDETSKAAYQTVISENHVG
ncbi:hypothetical protein ACX53_08750 [Loigolactobacillus backii]|nr:hypothetical protein ACX53_08750 [Loigolactobacillus backii]